MNNRPIVLTIAATDSAGMAGVQMDLKVQSAFEVHSIFAVTANTAQNNNQLLSLNSVDANVLEQQLAAVADYPIGAIKVGLIGNADQIRVIAKFIDDYNYGHETKYQNVHENGCKAPVIFDPVIDSTAKNNLFNINNIALLIELLLPRCTLITPNIHEAEILSQFPITNFSDMAHAARQLQMLGAKNILIKGGHLSSEMSQDYFLSEQKSFWLSSERLNVTNTRGTGCALASAISSSLALGYSLYDSVVIGKMAINQGLRESYSVANGKGPISISRFPDEQINLPILSVQPHSNLSLSAFPECNQPKLGLYPIVDSAEWISKLASQGITTIQLRVKNLKGDALEFEIKRSIEIAEKYHCRLFINDFWQLAIKHSAYGVHLGQEDIDDADIAAIQKAGLRLGISSHCHYEVARAIAYKPSYIACGPIYHTNTKQMPWKPQGIKGLSYWCKVLDFPIVAIGGINQQRVKQVVDTGVDSVAMISAITNAEQPEVTTKNILDQYF